MSTTLNPRAAGIVARVKAILLTPDTEWRIIDLEPATVRSLYLNYILILAAIPPIAGFLHGVLFGYGAFGFSYHPSFFGALTSAIVQYALSLASAYIFAIIIDALAPTFHGQKNQVQALKLVAYASTASWLAGIFSLIPGLGLLAILGLYSLFLFFRGLPVMMKSPPEKSLAYTAVIIVVAVVIAVVITPLSAALVGSGGSYRSTDSGGGSVTLPGGGTFQLDKMQLAAKAFEERAKHAENGTNPASVPAETLKAMLPASLSGGMARTEISSAGGEVAGFGGRSVEAKYGNDNRALTLTVADMGAAGALASFGGALGISGDKETPTSYSKLTTDGGRTVAEEYDRTEKRGSYSVIIASRFMVRAEGSDVSMDELHQAVGSVDAAALETLAK